MKDIVQQFEQGGCRKVASYVPHFRGKPMYQERQDDEMDESSKKFKAEPAMDEDSEGPIAECMNI